MIEGPGIAAASRSSENIVGYDLLPTFYEMAQGDAANDLSKLDGKSIIPILKNKSTSAFKERSLYFHYPHLRSSTPHSVVIKGDYKLFTFYEIADQPYLYKLSKDPGEETNLAKQMPEKAQALQQDLRKYLGRVGAYLPKKNPNAQTGKKAFDPDTIIPTVAKLGGKNLKRPNK